MTVSPGRAGLSPRFLLLALALHLGLAAWLLWQGTGKAAPRPEPLPVMVSLIPSSPTPPAARAEAQPPTPKSAPEPIKPTLPKPASKPVAPQKPAPDRALTPTPTAAAAADSPAPASEAAPASAPAASTAQPAGSGQDAPLSAPRFDAAYLHNPKPPYPLLARRRGVEGKVVLRVQVSAAGLAEQVQLHRSSGNDSLDEAALSTVRNWRFVPAQRGDTPLAASVLVPITFKLEN